ncbi:hypothetical protein [Nocardia xishanensis]|uniref:hypothetical protein n=1 Tax=Nocardia xishanensis TaxID=238964 RepID=UPI000B028830|nr:hypothetical protein [Nocardia xishanensis]
MTTSWITARTVLFRSGAPDAAVGELAECLRQSGVDRLALRRMPGAAAALQSTTLCEVAKAVDGLLEVDLGGVAVAGWRRYDRLRGAATRTRSGGAEQVALFEHEISQSYRPRLDVSVGGSPVGEFALELCVAMLLQPLTATVRDGMLAALGPGDCTVTVSVRAPEIGPIMVRKRIIRAATMVDLRRPIPLVAPQPVSLDGPPVGGPPLGGQTRSRPNR